MHRVDTILNDDRDKVKARSQALTINDYPQWLINSVPTFQPSLETSTSVPSDDTSDDVRDTQIDKQPRNPPARNPK